MANREQILSTLQAQGGKAKATDFFATRESPAETLRTHNALAKLRRDGLVTVERIINADGSRGDTVYHQKGK